MRRTARSLAALGLLALTMSLTLGAGTATSNALSDALGEIRSRSPGSGPVNVDFLRSTIRRTSSSLIRDGELGQEPAGAIQREINGWYEIGEQHGHRPGGGTNLFHSFSRFDLPSEDTANFTADTAYETENLVVRVWDAPSRIEGTLRTRDVPGANLYLLNPHGLVMGENSQLDVDGDLHLSTAESLAFAGVGETQHFEAREGGAVPTLAIAHPGEFGFLGDASQRIVLDSASLYGHSFDAAPEKSGVRGSISLHAGGVDLQRGAIIRATNQGVRIVATDSITLSGSEQGVYPWRDGSSIAVLNEDFADPNVIDPTAAGIELSADRIHLTDGAALSVKNNRDELTSGGTIDLHATSWIKLDGSDASDLPLGALKVDASEGLQETDWLIRLQHGSSDIFTINRKAADTAEVGNISLDAATITLRDGAELTHFDVRSCLGENCANPEHNGEENLAETWVPHKITLRASDRLEISGTGGGQGSGGSRVQTANAALLPENDQVTGNVLIQTAHLDLRDGGEISTRTTGEAHAGEIEIEATKLNLGGGSKINSSSEGRQIDFDDPWRTEQAVMGDAGEIRITTDEALVSGASEISVLAREGADASGLKPGEPTPEGTVIRGNIHIQANRLVLDEGSQIEASVGTGLGGSIRIGSPTEGARALVLRDGSHVLAQATDELGSSETPTRGGDIEINAQTVFQCPDCLINADGPSEGSEGSVVINNPESLIESQVLPPPVAYLDASSLMLERCGAQTSEAAAGRFAVARWPGLPLSPEGPLLAISTFGGEPGANGRTGTSLAAGDETGEDASLQLALRAAGDALRGGHSQRAGAEFAQTERAATAAGDQAARGDALRGLAEARQAAGGYEDSLAPLEEALNLARASGDAAREAAALGALGNAYVALGEFQLADSMLTQAVSVAQGDRSPDSTAGGEVPLELQGVLLNNLGNERAIAGDPLGALAAYRESAETARGAGQALGAAQAEANAARAALELGRQSEARRALDRARASLTAAHGTPAEDTALRIHLAHSEAALAERDPAARREAMLSAHADLMRASQDAEAAGDLRSASYALGNLGALYAQEGGRSKEALYLTNRALASAEQAQAADLLARWYAQAGQLEARRGQTESALAAYRRAVALLEETRPESASAYGSADLAFRQAVEPIYLALVDLLLRNTVASDAAAEQARLSEAREVVEQWKAAELRNYFRDSCVAELEATARSVESVDPGAAVIYPIVLPDRLELLVGRASGIARYSVPVDGAELDAQVKRFRQLLGKRTTNEFRTPAQQLHRWLVAPYQELLDAEQIHTLVFVPGGALRTVPMAALHDGQGFLLERYAVAVTPSLNLLAPKPIVPGETKVLMAGLSEAVQGYPALPGVPAELASIKRLYGGEVLLDQAFELGPFENSLRDLRPGVVHIASHAEFTGNPRTSFVLTHDDRLSIDQLAELVRAERYGREPVELLMLSACDTAVGDERSALGLAGMAVRAGARSAMGSLWSVSDEATSELVVGFYQALDAPGTSKAQALQQAQQSLLADSRYQHPYYWAPFLVINNWL